MNPDTEPPQTGGDNGAHRPTEENTSTAPPDSADPYAGLSIDQLETKLLDKLKEEKRQRLIRRLKDIPPDPPKPNPATVMNQRARKIRRAVNLPEKPSGDAEQSLFDQSRMLDVLFRQLMMDSAESEAFDERLGLSLALRTQNQYRHSLQVLDKMIKGGGFTRRK